MSPRTRLLLLLAAAIPLWACGGDSGPVTARIFGFDLQTKSYREFDAHLDSLDDVTQMRGDAVTFIGGATFTGDALATVGDPKSERILRADGGAPPACSFTLRDGVLHADDFDSFNMASAYYALDQSRKLFLGLGLIPEELNPVRAYYHPRVQMLTKVIPTFWYLIDNAAYAPPFDGFLIVPHVRLQGIPFTMNLGVMAHEYGHKVYNRLVEKGARQQAWLKHDWSLPAMKQVRGVDEGVADVFGHLITLDPDYFQASLEGTGVEVDRDLSEARVMPQAYAQALLEDGELSLEDPYDPHELGGFVAAALWRLGADLGDHRRVAQALVAVERDLGEAIAAQPKYDFSTLEFMDRVAQKFDGAERTAACTIFKERFAALIEADTAHPMGGCP